jgi:hypothetical protein
MGILKPVHPTAQISVGMGPDNQVKMIRHQTIGQDAHWHLPTGVRHSFEKGLVVAILAEYLLPGIATIKNVIASVSYRGTSGTRHAGKLPPVPTTRKRKR